MLAVRPTVARPASPESQYSQDPFGDANEHYPNEKNDFDHYGLSAPVHSSYASASSPAGPSAASTPLNFAPSDALAPLLDPRPEAFARAPPRSLTYPAFPPTAVYAWGTALEKGFPTLPPPSNVAPHPFQTHDVAERDWALFLGQLRAVAEAHPVNAVVAAVVPVAKSIRMPLGKFSPVTFVARQGVKAHVRSRRNGPVGELVDTWNQYFFYPRCMEVTLAQGKYIFSGTGEGLPPDMIVPTRSSANEAKWRLVLTARHWPAGAAR